MVPGGPGVPVVPRVASGEIAFGVVNADDVVAARAAGVDIVATLAPIQRSPWCVMVRADAGIASLDHLRGFTLAMQAGTSYVAWLEHTGRLRDVRIVPYGGSIAPFLATPRYAQQAYAFSEPVLAAAHGVDVRCLAIADTGFDPYASVLITSRATFAQRPQLVAAVTRAAARGWQRYLVDATATHAEILARNPEIGHDALERGARALAPLVLDEVARRDGLGSMRRSRWATLVEQMRTVGAIDRPVDPVTLFDAGFLPAPRTP